MDEYRINGLTIKENLLQLAENENKKFTESLHPGIENVLGIRIPALRRLGAQIAKDDWESYLQTADTYYMEERMLQGMVISNLKMKDTQAYLSLVPGLLPSSTVGLFVTPLTFTANNGLWTRTRKGSGYFWKTG
jgi:hypothetical protein